MNHNGVPRTLIFITVIYIYKRLVMHPRRLIEHSQLIQFIKPRENHSQPRGDRYGNQTPTNYFSCLSLPRWEWALFTLGPHRVHTHTNGERVVLTVTPTQLRLRVLHIHSPATPPFLKKLSIISKNKSNTPSNSIISYQ